MWWFGSGEFVTENECFFKSHSITFAQRFVLFRVNLSPDNQTDQPALCIMFASCDASVETAPHHLVYWCKLASPKCISLGIPTRPQQLETTRCPSGVKATIQPTHSFIYQSHIFISWSVFNTQNLPLTVFSREGNSVPKCACARLWRTFSQKF